MQVIQVEHTNEMLTALVDKAINCEEIIFTKKEKPVVKMNSLPIEKKPLQYGSGKDVILYIADDFDETPEEFKEYIE